MNQRPEAGNAGCRWRSATAALIAAALLSGCWDDSPHEQPSPSPLQPLVYTEDPDLTPAGAAVRERRLHRQLLEGSTDDDWGRLHPHERSDRREFDSIDELGKAVVEALTSRDERLFEQVFVSVETHSRIAEVDSQTAEEYVDNELGASGDVWALFSRDRPASIPEGGFGAQLDFEAVELGSSQRIELADGSQWTRHRDNSIAVRWQRPEVTLHLEVPQIIERSLPVDDTDDPSAESNEDAGSDADESPAESAWKIGSRIAPTPGIEQFVDAGLHLEPRLLRADEYPFPLGTGTFWRYRRVDPDDDRDERDVLDRRFDEETAEIVAEEVIVEVREVSNFGSLRLVELLRSYDDHRHTRVREWWAVTPGCIYYCDETCREHIEDIDWLLGYFDDRVPILKFPLEPGGHWGEGAREVEPEQAVFSVHDDWLEVDTPAGFFAGIFRIEGTGDLGDDNRYFEHTVLRRDFAVGRGIVRRIVEPLDGADEQTAVVEELVEYRLME